MEGIEGTTCMLNELTFEPNCCSTQNFTKMARLASTPFNQENVNALPNYSIRYQISCVSHLVLSWFFLVLKKKRKETTVHRIVLQLLSQ